MKKAPLIISLLALASDLIAQPPPPPDIPVDGGISFLIAAGLGLGAKKIIDSRSKK